MKFMALIASLLCFLWYWRLTGLLDFCFIFFSSNKSHNHSGYSESSKATGSSLSFKYWIPFKTVPFGTEEGFLVLVGVVSIKRMSVYFDMGPKKFILMDAFLFLPVALRANVVVWNKLARGNVCCKMGLEERTMVLNILIYFVKSFQKEEAEKIRRGPSLRKGNVITVTDFLP